MVVSIVSAVSIVFRGIIGLSKPVMSRRGAYHKGCGRGREPPARGRSPGGMVKLTRVVPRAAGNPRHGII